jgi:hypothetical protein
VCLLFWWHRRPAYASYMRSERSEWPHIEQVHVGPLAALGADTQKHRRDACATNTKRRPLAERADYTQEPPQCGGPRSNPTINLSCSTRVSPALSFGYHLYHGIGPHRELAELRRYAADGR